MRSVLIDPRDAGTISHEVVNKIINDINLRGGLGDVWDTIDSETQREIKYAWVDILFLELQKPENFFHTDTL